MNKTVIQLIAVVIVAVIIVAAAVVVLSGGDDDDDIDIPEVASGTGTVYGNADGNCYIDEVDLAIIQSIIDGERSFSDFPFADADCDGDVDEDDLVWVQNMIDKVDMKVYVLDTQDNIVSVQYPISSMIVLSGSNLAPLMNVLDITDLVTAAAYSTLDPIRDYSIYEGINNGTITRLTTNGTAADLDTISQLDVQVMFTEYSSMYDLDSDENIAILNDWGIDVLCMECRDPGDDTRTMAVFGILLDRSDEAQSYIDFVNDVYGFIEETVGDRWGTSTAMITSNTGGVSGTTSGYNTMLQMAGGTNLADFEDNNRSVEVGSVWILEEKYASDFLFLGASSNYGGTGFSSSSIATYEEIYHDHTAWQNGNAYIFSTGIPVVTRVAYLAEALYSDLFESGWANSIHQLFIDTYFDVEFEVNQEQFFRNIST